MTPSPTVAVAGYQTVEVQHSGDDVVTGNQRQFADGGNDVGGSAVALTALPFGQTYLAMNATGPMNNQYGFGCRVVDIGDHFMDHGSYDALFQPCIG